MNTFWNLFHPKQEDVGGNFGLSWTFLTFYFITPDLRKRYVSAGKITKFFKIIKHFNIIFNTDFGEEII